MARPIVNVYGVYNIREKERCEFVGTFRELMDFLGMSRNVLYSSMSHGTIIRRKYEVVKVFQEPAEFSESLREAEK